MANAESSSKLSFKFLESSALQGNLIREIFAQSSGFHEVSFSQPSVRGSLFFIISISFKVPDYAAVYKAFVEESTHVCTVPIRGLGITPGFTPKGKLEKPLNE